MRDDNSREILLGVVTGAHGLTGEVKVKTFTDTPDTLGAYGALHARDGRRFTVAASRVIKPDVAVVRFREIAGRHDAEALHGTELFVARAALPPAGEEEFYHADLIGLAAADGEGRVLGTVKAVHNFGAGDVIEIARADGSELFLPFTREIVPAIDLEHGRMVVAVPEESGEAES
jgi:16S rRNA processing protein RimM